TIPQQDVARVPVGTPVRIVLPGTEPPRLLTGKIAAVDPNVDPTTRAVKLRATVVEETKQETKQDSKQHNKIASKRATKGDKEGDAKRSDTLSPNQLRPGMFVKVSVVLPERASVVFVPATAVMRAPYGNSVYIVEDRKDEKGAAVTGPDGKPAKAARQQFVRVGVARGDFVAIEEGVTAGQEVVMLGAFKLRNGAPVMVNNQTTKLSPSQTPTPPNR
ncbi:MAG: HlyD family efflux transporter periplasmic adaptor subunit, partial [Myxococcales bacterium]